MRYSLSAALCCAGVAVMLTGPGRCQVGPALSERDGPLPPFEISDTGEPRNRIDDLVLAQLNARGLQPARLCSDAVFVRRVYLDMTGALPTPMEARSFLNDKAADKRTALIDALFTHAAFDDYWALKWCDLLRVKAEFPINLWPNGVQAYHRWVRDAVGRNMPYDRFVEALLTSSGSNFRVPPVNFYRAIQGKEPGAIAAAAALTMMGSRIETWPVDRREGLETLFSRVAFKPTAEWKEEIVHLDPAEQRGMRALLPDGTMARVGAGEDPRRVFADWLLADDNPVLARAAANRVWSWFMGRGIIHETDDIRPDNPPSHPELLDHLADTLVRSGYDLRALYRHILTSRTYQQSSRPLVGPEVAASVFACYPVRQLPAEVLIDALCDVFSSTESYRSQIPEPFTFVPERQRTIALADGSITSPFLEMFGRPARDTGHESERTNTPTAAQRMHMLNSSHVQSMIERSLAFRKLSAKSKVNRSFLIRSTYLRILSRYPTEREEAAAAAYFSAEGAVPRAAAADICWALVNTKEFLCRH